MMKNVRHQRRLALLAGMFLSMAAVPFVALSVPGPGPGSDDETYFVPIGKPDWLSNPHHRVCYVPWVGPVLDRDLETGETIYVPEYYQGCNPCSQLVLGLPGEESGCYLHF